MVSSAVLGIDQEAMFIGGKVIHIHPPTIRRFAGAVRYLKGDGSTLKDVVLSTDAEGLAKALSWFVAGDESLYEFFLDCRLDEVQSGVILALDLLNPENFIRLSALQRNVRSLIARPRS